MSIKENIDCIRNHVDISLAKRNNRNMLTGDQAQIIGVTKTQTVEAIEEAIAGGISIIGENRVQEAAAKYERLQQAAIQWHLIGHLQTNKVRQAVTLFDVIESVDSEKLAQEIDNYAGKISKCQDIFLQVNVAGEESKYGLPPDLPLILALAGKISKLTNIRLCGLMTIAPYFEEKEPLRPVFRELYNIFAELQNLELPNTDIRWLSMGMTNDYQLAIEEGANLVRIGTGIFGTR